MATGRTKTLAIFAALALSAGAAPAASAGGAVEGYVETFPGAGGDEPAVNAGDRPDAPPPAPPPAAPAAVAPAPPPAIDQAPAADLARKTAPERKRKPGGQASSPAPVLPAVVETPTADESGTGILIPLTIGAGLVAAAAFLFVRRRQQLGSV